MASTEALQLAARLRQLRANADLTQAALARAFSEDGNPVGVSTVSSWESATAPKSPPRDRIPAYARFFCTRRSHDAGPPRLIPEQELTPAENEQREALQRELFRLLDAVRAPATAEPVPVRGSWHFNEGPVTIICPEVPEETRGPLASATDPNFTELLRYADLDALIELHGHIRSENPRLGVFHRRASRVVPDDLSGHVVLLGGIGWNQVTQRVMRAVSEIPVHQVDDPTLKTGEPFVVTDSEGERRFLPEWADPGQRELVADVALLARLRNPFNSQRTLTLCNGIHSRGVLGAVRCLTDAQVRDANERYLAERFGLAAEYAMLLKVEVIQGQSMSPDLNNAGVRLYEWSSAQAATS